MKNINTKEEMIDEFQCPGCVCGISTKDCAKYKFEEDPSDKYFFCNGHVPGTNIGAHELGRFCLGLPKGFCRVGYTARTGYQSHVRLYISPEGLHIWDKFNVAVWAMEKDGFLFVRTYCPRINISYVDVTKCGTLDLVPGSIDVSKFYDEMD